MSQDEQGSQVDAVPAGSDTVSPASEVVASVEALEGQPVEEHVAVFEQAHERLRRALDQRHG